MSEPIWIEKVDCIAFHSALLARFGGLDGIRDEGLLESALNRPIDLFHYKEPALFELAASYAVGIVKNHPFVDGNKRSAFMAAALFLEVNGFEMQAPETEAVLQTLALAASEIRESDYSLWLEASCKKR
ncbi:MAG: type II toxin-antitoxin system death-on-curing family toxin [Verrucomicrobiales bacterium]|nr:type II toxin-antitoxin system death-on-curing family toxin [Verrucomicrobiales bacterium]